MANNPFGGFGEFQGFDSGNTSPFNSSSTNLGVQDLYQLAQMQGGAVAQAANEIYHPSTGILSTIGNGFKKAFKGFIDVISLPSEIVAGVISSRYTVSEAIKKGIKPSDVIFGENSKPTSTMGKIGSFLVRTAADILLDPLTYVTFGAGQGIMGLRATSKVSLGAEAAAKLGVEELSTKALSAEGQGLYKYLTAVTHQKDGIRFIGENKELFSMADDTLKTLLKDSIDAPLNMDFAKKTISNMLEKSPALTETLLDKGGIKFFGKTMLSGQRISAALQLVPGVTQIDRLTEPFRMKVQALFDPALVKVGNNYVRLPEEFVGLETAARDLAESMGDSRVLKLRDIAQANKLTVDESKQLLAAVEWNKLPADPRLANAFRQLQGFGEEDYKFLRDVGIPVAHLDNHVPHILVQENIKTIPFTTKPVTKVGAAMQRGFDQPIFKDISATVKNSGMEIFDDNIITSHVARTLDNVRVGVSRQFQESVAVHFGVPASIAPQGYVPLSSKVIDETAQKVLKTYENIDQGILESLRPVVSETGEEMLYHPAIAKRIENFMGAVINDEATGDMLKAFDSLQNAWKASVTSIFPAFHGRNAISNVFLNFMDLGRSALDPAIHAQSASLIGMDMKYTKLAKEAAGEGIEGIQVFRGGSKLDLSKLTEEGISVTVDKKVANEFKNLRESANITGERIVEQFVIPKNSKIAKLKDIPEDFIAKLKDGTPFSFAEEKVVKWAKEQGFDAIDFTDFPGSTAKAEKEIRVINPNILSTDKINNARTELANLLNKKVFTDGAGYEWTFGELRQAIKNNNVAFNRNITGSIDVSRGAQAAAEAIIPGAKSKAKEIAQNVLPFSQDFFGFKAGIAFGKKVEEQARLVNFIANLKNTGDVQLAAQRTKQFLFDYGNLTKFEKTFLKRVIPFYTFTRKNLELQAKSLMEVPGRVAAEVTALENLGDAIGGGKMTDEERARLPEWLQQGITFLKSRKGSTLEVLGSLGTPIEQPFQAFQPNVLLGSISPIIRVPVEQMTGYSFFNGKMLSDVTNAAAFKSAPQAIKEFIGYTEFHGKDRNGKEFTQYISLNPSRMNLVLNLPPTSRVLSSLKQIQDLDVSAGSKLLQQTTGLKAYSVDLAQEDIKRQLELKRKLEDLLTKARITGQFTKTYLPKAK